ncbi:MAG: circadian clock protein KaiC [Gammaproteobacteria bacterium]|nr:circadian clock protein KaiC [Gammaproteobacteria bacterium]MCP5459584.1 circadian clock protein KaiC [Gammaproteobacteria bacterium]
MSNTTEREKVEKIQTHIEGFDQIGDGGLPKGRCSLITGTAGSAKTVFAIHFLVAGIEHSDEGGVFVTFEETPDDIRKNMSSMGWDIPAWESKGKWMFVDAAPDPTEEIIEAGSYDLGALLARIESAVNKIGAKRLALDSLGGIFYRFADDILLRRELLRISRALKEMNLTTVLTAERDSETGEISRYGVEEFVADSVIILRNAREEEKRRRTIEILKYRGAMHHKGEFPFTVIPTRGVVVIPLSAIELKQKSSDVRIASGNADLDRMCGGGFFRDSLVLVSGATGCGKTLLSTEFIAGGVTSGERCLLFAFEESREQLFRNATGWGVDFKAFEDAGLLKVVCEYPESAGLEDHLLRMQTLMTEYQPRRMAVDSVSALERVAGVKGFREFIIGLTSFTKAREITGLFTSTTPSLMGGESVTEAHFSTITDSIILLRYVEMFGEMRRGLAVLKMRGSMHEKDIREFSIDNQGMHIGKPFRNVTGILAGHPTQLIGTEVERMSDLFKDGPI